MMQAENVWQARSGSEDQGGGQPAEIRGQIEAAVERAGRPGAAQPGVMLTPERLGLLMPMFLWLDRRGRIRAVGPTLRKIVGPEAVGAAFARYFSLRRARGGERPATVPTDERGAEFLAGLAFEDRIDADTDIDIETGGGPPGRAALAVGRRLTISLVAHPSFTLRATAVDLGGQDLLLNLSFGIHLPEAVRFFGLTEADFAASDLAMELLFLAEAKTAVLDELRALTQRLDAARREAVSKALSDPLTGLANRRALEAALDRAAKAQARGGRGFALLLLDLDFFKQINDTLGHAAGDAALIQVAQALSGETRRGDLVARVGGDEFMLILRGPLDAARLAGFAVRLIARLEEPMQIEGRACRISASIGAVLSEGARSPDLAELMAKADSELYRAKGAGRGRCCIASC